MRNPTSLSGSMHALWRNDVMADTDRSFLEWIKLGKHPFTKRGNVGDGDYDPFYSVNYPQVPINRKGIQFWAQPKMGQFHLLPLELKKPFVLENLLGLKFEDLLHINQSDDMDLDLSKGFGGDMFEIYNHLKKHHTWDLEMQQKLEMTGVI